MADVEESWSRGREDVEGVDSEACVEGCCGVVDDVVDWLHMTSYVELIVWGICQKR